MEKNQLGILPIKTLMLKLSAPSILAQLVNILYNIVDRIYIGHLAESSSLALTGLGLCFPIVTLISAFSFFAGSGGAPLASIELGKSEIDPFAKNSAESILGTAVAMLLCFSILLGGVFFIFREPILIRFGASHATLPFASEYLRIYLCGTIFVLLSVGLNPFITCQGHARTAMISTLIGAASNIILDPIFIFALNLGVKGAAIATVISQFFSALWIVIFLRSSRSQIRIKKNLVRFQKFFVLKISSLGISPFIMSATESVILVVFNSGLQKFGNDFYVGAMTILQSLMQLVFVPIQGFTDGVFPIIGYNYGAKKICRVKKTIFWMTTIAFFCTAFMFLVLRIFPKYLIGIFTENEELLKLTQAMLPIYLGAVWIFGLQMGAQRTFVALGKAGTSIFIALLRKVILLIPLALILPHFFGVKGIFFAEPIASTISAITSIVFLVHLYRRL